MSVAALEQQYGQLVRFYQQQGLRDLDAPIQARLRQMAMDQAITRELIGQEARRQGIVVTDDDVSATIKSLPAFQTAGKFDLELYRRAVTSSLRLAAALRGAGAARPLRPEGDDPGARARPASPRTR